MRHKSDLVTVCTKVPIRNNGVDHGREVFFTDISEVVLPISSINCSVEHSMSIGFFAASGAAEPHVIAHIGELDWSGRLRRVLDLQPVSGVRIHTGSKQNWALRVDKRSAERISSDSEQRKVVA